MTPAATRGGASLRVPAVLRRWAPVYCERFDTRVPARHQFLFPVKTLGAHFRTLFREALEAAVPLEVKRLPAKVWKQPWVVHCAPAGSGAHALRYLARYAFKTATGDRRLLPLADGRLGWP